MSFSSTSMSREARAVYEGEILSILLYGSEAGYCIKEDEHRAIFDAAVRCLWADDPFAAVRGGRW